MRKEAAPTTETTTKGKSTVASVPPKASKKPKAPPKKALCLYHLYRRSLVQLEALSLYGETCLHSTISDLANNHGLEFERKREAHTHQNGGTAYFIRYTLTEESRPRAANLLKHYGLDPDA